eukprot:7230988-Pyramimonas_sp.AAC.1
MLISSATKVGCEMRNCCHFRGLLGDPAGWGLAQIRAGPRRRWGAVTCEAVAAFEGCWWRLAQIRAGRVAG